MDGLGNLDSFIAGCDATKIGAFLELVQRRFSEAQAQKQKRLEGFVLHWHRQVADLAEKEKTQHNERIRTSLDSLNRKRSTAAAELTQSLETARAKKQALLKSFEEQDSACQEIEREMKELTQKFTAKQQQMEKRHKQTLKAFFESAVQRIHQEKEAAMLSLQETETEKRKTTQLLLELLIAYAGPHALSQLSAA